jgi:hypothetical protein
VKDSKMTAVQRDPFSSYQYGEGRTGIGQAVEFSCPSGHIEDVKAFLAENIRTIRPPVTRELGQDHGGYIGYSRYVMKQYDYAGGRGGFIEVLEVENAPEDRFGIVCYEYSAYGESSFSEWKTVEDARSSFKLYFSGNRESRAKLPTLPGFKRLVQCGVMTPWFYAIGDEELVGDYTFPHGLQEDATYRFGRKFLVYGWNGIPSIKACMGTRFVREKSSNYPYTDKQYRMVYRNDGTAWKEGDTHHDYPHPIEDGELWIAEAVQQFRELLAGQRTDFFIKFTDGNQFVGKLSRVNRRDSSTEGKYSLVVNIKGEAKALEGWVDFKPTSDAPDIVQFVTQSYARANRVVERIEVKKCENTQGGKKWAGVYHAPSVSKKFKILPRRLSQSYRGSFFDIINSLLRTWGDVRTVILDQTNFLEA